jgi:CHASE2 domain-containing sensor protein
MNKTILAWSLIITLFIIGIFLYKTNKEAYEIFTLTLSIFCFGLITAIITRHVTEGIKELIIVATLITVTVYIILFLVGLLFLFLGLIPPP